MASWLEIRLPNQMMRVRVRTCRLTKSARPCFMQINLMECRPDRFARLSFLKTLPVHGWFGNGLECLAPVRPKTEGAPPHPSATAPLEHPCEILACLAMACPDPPKPTMPNVAPCTSCPSKRSGLQVVHCPLSHIFNLFDDSSGCRAARP